MSRFVVVSGLPASGKSTVGHLIADGLGLPLLDKDVVLESLFERVTPTDVQGRNELSRVADDMFQAQAVAATGGVLVSWWRHPRSTVESGTTTMWLASLPGALVEVHCLCVPLVAAKRFLACKRHPGHLDGQRTLDQLLVQFNQHAARGSLGIGSLVEVRTDEAINTTVLLGKVDQAFDALRHAQPAA